MFKPHTERPQGLWLELLVWQHILFLVNPLNIKWANWELPDGHISFPHHTNSWNDWMLHWQVGDVCCTTVGWFWEVVSCPDVTVFSSDDYHTRPEETKCNCRLFSHQYWTYERHHCRRSPACHLWITVIKREAEMKAGMHLHSAAVSGGNVHLLKTCFVGKGCWRNSGDGFLTVTQEISWHVLTRSLTTRQFHWFFFSSAYTRRWKGIKNLFATIYTQTACCLNWITSLHKTIGLKTCQNIELETDAPPA